MKNEWQIVVGGSGGQGLMLAGNFISVAATEIEGKYATQRNYYGPEKRGGYASSEIRISDSEIIFPAVEKADIVILLHNAALKEYTPKLDGSMTVIYDSSSVDFDPDAVTVKKAYAIPMTDMAREIGAVQSLNIIALGALVAATNVLRRDSLIGLIKKTFPKSADINTRAFEMGEASIR